VNELFRRSTPIIGPVQALEKKNPLDYYTTHKRFDAKTVNELFRGSTPIIGPVPAPEKKNPSDYYTYYYTAAEPTNPQITDSDGDISAGRQA
jgi:hypothetical protein